jgi:hypothetical protein
MTMKRSTTTDSNRSDSSMIYKRFVCVVIGVVIVPLLLKHYVVQHSIDRSMTKDRSSSPSSIQRFVRQFNVRLIWVEIGFLLIFDSKNSHAKLTVPYSHRITC